MILKDQKKYARINPFYATFQMFKSICSNLMIFKTIKSEFILLDLATWFVYEPKKKIRECKKGFLFSKQTLIIWIILLLL